MSHDLCYLCGKPLVVPISADHVPPKQLFAAELRRIHSPQLVTVDVHDHCNKAYQLDEDYFVHALTPFARGTYAGQAVYKDVLAKFRDRKKIGLTTAVLKEFDPRPSGLVLPGNKVVKRFQADRLTRIVWKIVRGLYFQHHGIVLPADHRVSVSITPTQEGQEPPEHFQVFMQHNKDKEPLGQYQGVFSYRFDRFSEGPEQHDIHYWALLIWDSILFNAIFHDPSCPSCQNEQRERTKNRVSDMTKPKVHPSARRYVGSSASLRS